MTPSATPLLFALLFLLAGPAQAARARGPAAARDALAEGRIGEALLEYRKALDRKDDPALRCEYAFAFAGLGLKALAMDQLDKAAAEGSFPGQGAWFRGQILRAAGIHAAEGELGEGSQAPEWFGEGTLKEFSDLKSGAGGIQEHFLDANRLAAEGRHHLSAAEFASALAVKPQDLLGWIGYSIVLEKLGAIESAHQALDHAIPLAEKYPAIQRLILARRLQLGDPKDFKAQRQKKALDRDQRDKHFLIFAGASMVNDGASSGTGRLGYFVTPVLDAAIDLGYSDFGPKAGSGQRSRVDLGASMRRYWPVGKKAGAAALGLRLSHAPGYNGADGFTSVTLSPGFTSPFGDLFLDLTWHSGGYQIGLTVGFTGYFGGGQ